jgi:uncharacterized protein (DUF488 family)
VEIYTIGFTKKRAEAFFDALRRAGIGRLLDVRLNNTSQLAGFTQREDLPFFLRELCGADYVYEPMLAPTDELLRGYRRREIDWRQYEERFLELMDERSIEAHLNREFFSTPTALLCSEPMADQCHRRLVLEYLGEKWGSLSAIHL